MTSLLLVDLIMKELRESERGYVGWTNSRNSKVRGKKKGWGKGSRRGEKSV